MEPESEIAASRARMLRAPTPPDFLAGLMVMAIIYFMGTVGGAHLNPAVTLAFALRRNFPWGRVPGYIGAQLVGGVLAASLLRTMFGVGGALGATVPRVDFQRSYGADHRNSADDGTCQCCSRHRLWCPKCWLQLALAGLWAAPISGASINPVRSLAPDLIRGNLTTSWIYIVGPLLGALVAVLFE